MASRRQFSPFNLAFLDIMFCGFGAVVLFVLLVNAQQVQSRKQKHEDLRGEVDRLEREVEVGEQYRGDLHSRLLKTEEELKELQEQIRRAETRRFHLQTELKGKKEEIAARRQHVKDLASALKAMEAEQRQLETVSQDQDLSGSKSRPYEGEGNRQYLTGLKLGGRRVLILVDASASMLDTSVVGVLRLRNMRPEQQKQSAKWRQVQETVRWLVANLPVTSNIQLMVFTSEARSLFEKKTWLSMADGQAVGDVMTRFMKILPAGGTSLGQAFSAAAVLSPRPDNILLLTDGLPTQGMETSRQTLVSGIQREKFFKQAVEKLPAGIPVNTILFPMEGDPQAAVLYWALAIQSKGSFLTPTQDWP